MAFYGGMLWYGLRAGLEQGDWNVLAEQLRLGIWPMIAED